MSINTISPSHMSLTEWADFMVPNLEQFGNLGRLWSEDAWREWASQLLNLPQISGSVIPDPYTFDDWRTWASRLNDNLSVVP